MEEQVLKELEELRGLLAHKLPDASMKDILVFAIERTLKELRPKAPKVLKVKENKKPFPAPEAKALGPGSRYISAEVRRSVWARERGRCTFMNPTTGRKCGSKHGLELDHIHPFALGGQTTVENLRLTCRAHNQLAAVHTYGRKKMSRFVPRLK